MPIAPCMTTVDERGRELVQHGTAEFPIACYHDDLGTGDVPWHWHEELEAVVIAQGSTVVAAGKEKYVVRQGEGFFINSGILHGCWDHENSGCRYHSLVFHPRLVGGGLDSVFHRRYVQPLVSGHTLESIHLKLEEPWQCAALEAIENAWQAGVHEPPGYEFRVRGALSELVWLLGEHLPRDRQAPGGKTLRDGERIKVMLQFVHDHYAEPLDAKAIAQSANLSESECLRCFRSAIGTTPIRYLRQYRIQQAAALLTSTQDRVADIAERCGFSDVSYFTKTFREMKGCPPLKFRSQ